MPKGVLNLRLSFVDWKEDFGMGRVYRKPKEVEKFLIRRFVQEMLGYTISRPIWCERPDAILTLHKRHTKKRVAIEHTSYHSDAEAGQCSPQTPIAEFWKRVQISLARRIGQRKHLADIMGGVWLNTRQFTGQFDPKAPEALARVFAKELIDFLEQYPLPESEFVRYPPPYTRRSDTDFFGLSTLRSLLTSMTMRRCPGSIFFPRCSWKCNSISTGCIGLSLTYVRSAIQKKNKKANSYDWRSAEEKWLLIVAEGGTLGEHVGASEEHEWVDAGLSALCNASPFDRIYFWEYPRSWYKSLKPNRRIVTETP